MKDYKQGDIVILPFRFQEIDLYKKRPVILLSKEDKHGNFTAAKITSQLKYDEYSFLIDSDLDSSMPKDSEVRTNDIMLVNKREIIKRVSHLNNPGFKKLTEKICSILDR